MSSRQKMIFESDPYLQPYKEKILSRQQRIIDTCRKIAGEGRTLSDAINGYLYYGVHHQDNYYVFREWAPNATKIYLIGDMNNWHRDERFAFAPVGNGNWELKVPAYEIHHGDLYKWYIEWPGGGGERIPAYARRCVQDSDTKIFAAQIWEPETPYKWKFKKHVGIKNPLIYEVHIGMSSENCEVAGFTHFRRNVLPRIIDLGYNTIQIMALQEHPYYGSFGYQVANFFATSSRFGTPDELKALIDEAHRHNIAVVMDIVHSHAVKNEAEGLSRFDGSETLYFHGGERGQHPAWESRCFDYGKSETQHFLLSNCKYWLEEFHIDGFRFDGVTSMIYHNHGLGIDFNGYEQYFNDGVDEDALVYLGLANILIKEIFPKAITIAEDMSGLAGLAAPLKAGGIGFDYRMSMGVPDLWIKWLKERTDWQWSMGGLWYELTNKRADEKTISYAECHDQALVGDKTLIFRMLDKEMYTSMNKGSQSPVIDRGIALHKMIRLVTLATAGNGYLTFMGNEFGHPEWIDFPRAGNGWSYHYARRQWSLADNGFLRYGELQAFDKVIIQLFASDTILAGKPELIYTHENDKILIFKRKNYLFVFNFNPEKSFTDYGFAAPAGKWECILNSDNAVFGGFDRIDTSIAHFTRKIDRKDMLSLYMPSRTVQVLKLA